MLLNISVQYDVWSKDKTLCCSSRHSFKQKDSSTANNKSEYSCTLTGRAAELCRAAWDGERRTNGCGGRINCSCLQLASESAASWKVSFPRRKMMLVAGIPFQACGQVRWLKRCLDFFLLLLFLNECRWVTGGSWWPWYHCPRMALSFPRDRLRGSGQLQVDFVI